MRRARKPITARLKPAMPAGDARAAKAQGCRYLITEDPRHEQTIDGVQILNAFRVGPEVLAPSAP